MYGGPMTRQPYSTYGAMPQPGESAGQGYILDPSASLAKPPPFGRGVRRAVSIAAVTTALVLPCTVFLGVFGLMSFSVHYSSPGVCNAGLGLAGLLVLMLGHFAVQSWRRRGEGHQDPGWYIFLFATCLCALLVGYILGDQNFRSNLTPFFEISNLNFYPNVDPSKFRGQQLMDAGRIQFVEGTYLDISRSMGFKNVDTYCVAPVVLNGTEGSLASFDFWAVGLNCCSHSADFHCGEYNNAKAKSGLRLMLEDQQPFFRLAVQQAEAAYNIHSLHPIFLHWLQDPSTEISAFQEDGYKFFLMGAVGFFAFQLVAVIAAVIVFAKMGL